jgi:hypothetical protein
MIDCADGYRLRGHVPVAGGTVHSRADVWCMVEFHVRGGLKAIHALPRHVLAAIPVAFNLLDLRLVRGNCLMARHTQTNARNFRVGSSAHAGMTIEASQSFLEMNLMREGNRLNGRSSPAKILTNGRESSSMCWSEDIVACSGWRREVLRLDRRIELKKHPSENHREEQNRKP